MLIVKTQKNRIEIKETLKQNSSVDLVYVLLVYNRKLVIIWLQNKVHVTQFSVKRIYPQ